MYASDFTCRYALVGLGCGITESLVLGILFVCGGACCIYLLYKLIREKRKDPSRCSKFSIVFSISMAIWMFYRATICIFPFPLTSTLYRILYSNVPAILFSLPLSLFVLLICELLFTYNTPGARLIVFYRTFFVMFIIVFALIGLVLAYANAGNDVDLDQAVSLWHACTDFLNLIFFVIPARRLLYAISQPNAAFDPNYQIMVAVGIWLFSLIYGARGLYNILTYFGINSIQKYLSEASAKAVRIPAAGARFLTVIYYFLFDFCGSMVILIGVFILQKHDRSFYVDPRYVTEASDAADF